MKSTLVSAFMGLMLAAFCAIPAQAQTTWYSYVGNPVIPYAMEPSVLFDSTSQLYRMWFIKTGTGIVDAESPDGLNWFIGDSVVLKPGPVGAFDQNIHSLSVIKKDSTFLMYYSASRDGSTQVIGRAVSSDGRHWQKNPGTPVLVPGDSGTWDSRAVAGAKLVVEGGTFKMWFAGSNGTVSATGHATSADGIVWTKHPGNPVLNHGAPGSYDASEAGIMAVAKRESLYYMIYRGINGSGKMAFCLGTSTDGIIWWKYPGNPVKRPGTSWDSFMIGSGTLIWVNQRFDLWYCGSDGYSWYIGVAMDEFVPLAVKESGERAPATIRLMQNYPNPFNPSTAIRYGLPNRGHVSLTIFNALGQEVAVLQHGEQEAGYHEVRFDGRNLASGVYFCRMQAEGSVLTTKILLMK